MEPLSVRLPQKFLINASNFVVIDFSSVIEPQLVHSLS